MWGLNIMIVYMLLIKMTVDLNNFVELETEKMRKSESEEEEMRKTAKCANPVEITFFCELEGYDIKTLNTTTGKGSYMLKVGQKNVVVSYTSKRTTKQKNVPLTLYKMKGLRGFLRRAAEARLLRHGKSPCCPTANYPHEEILEKHVELGYHEQGTCTPMCMVRRLFGSLYNPASIKITPPYIAKATLENIPTEVNQYLDENIKTIFGFDYCVVFHNGESTLKVETFNIINRATEMAVNNFMKHTANGTFPFKVVFSLNSGTGQEFIENIGFFLASLNEINRENGIQIGADKNNGSGQVKIHVKDFKINQKIPEIEGFVKNEKSQEHTVKFGDVEIQDSITEYYLESTFGKYAVDAFNALVGI